MFDRGGIESDVKRAKMEGYGGVVLGGSGVRTDATYLVAMRGVELENVIQRSAEGGGGFITRQNSVTVSAVFVLEEPEAGVAASGRRRDLALVIERELVARVRTVKTVALTLWEPVGLAEAACSAVIVAEHGVDGVRSDVGGDALPGTVGESGDHGCTGGMTHPLVEPENIPEKLLL